MQKKDRIEKNVIKNGLYLVATPIGNMGDLSERANMVIKNLDIIICENPNHSIKLLNKLGIKKKLISLHDHNEGSVIKKILKYQYNSKIGLISDAGSPLISDPGYKLVKNFIDNNIYVTSIPGPSSVIASLQISGLPINNFIFFGFAPKQKRQLKDFLIKIYEINTTAVFFVSGKRLENVIGAIIEFIKDAEISICKEITKLNEYVFRGSAINIYQKLLDKHINIKGEFTIVVSCKTKKNKIIADSNIKNNIKILLKKYSLTEVVKIVHNLTSISKKHIYETALKIKND